MSFLSSLDITGSGLTAQKLRMDIISQNIANAETTRTENGGTYRRKVVVLESMQEERPSFKAELDAVRRANGQIATTGELQVQGVRVERVLEDPTEFVPVYDPTHPDANEEGYVMYPNVDFTQEIIDMMGASRAYEANITAFNAVKQMLQQALQMGR